MRQDVEPSPVGHADDRLARAVHRGELDREIEHRHRHVEAFDREALLPEIRLVQETLERLDGGQPGEQLPLPFSRERSAVLARFDHLPQPQTFLVTADVLDLVCNRAAVGGAQIRERLGERLARHVDAQHVGGYARHDLGRQSETTDIERGIARRLAAEGIEPCRQMTEIPMGTHERVGRGDVFEVVGACIVRGAWCVVRGRAGWRSKGGGFGRATGRGWRTRALGNLLVKPFLSLQQGIERAEKHPGLGALDDAMVVRAGDRDDLRARDVADGARRDDRALALHEPRHRRHGAQCPGVRQLDRAAGEVVGHQPVCPGLLDDCLVRGVERGEIHSFGVFDHRDDECPATVFLLDIDGQAQPDRSGVDAMWLSVDFLEDVRHHREALRGQHDGVADQMRERDLAAA